jgi:cell division septation protein DedD
MSDELDIPSPTYRVPRHRRGMDAGTRRLAIIAGGLGGVLVLLVGGWSLLGHRSAGVPVIEADSSPLRVKPENPGGMSVAGSNEEILSDGADGTVGKLAPASETPAPQNMQAAKPSVVASAPPPLAATSAPTAPPLVAAAPVAKPPSSAPVHVATAEPTHPMSGKGTLVQLAALSSEDAAKMEWGRLEKRMPDLFGKRQPAVSKIEHDGKTFWRLRTGGFSDIAQATAFCEQVRAKGNGCSIAAF